MKSICTQAPHQRIAKVSTPLPTIQHYKTDAVDKAIDKFLFTTRTLLVTFLGTIGIILMVWATWNLKNYLKIDLMSGPHHELIDNVNEAFSI